MVDGLIIGKNVGRVSKAQNVFRVVSSCAVSDCCNI